MIETSPPFNVHCRGGVKIVILLVCSGELLLFVLYGAVDTRSSVSGMHDTMRITALKGNAMLTIR